jgi:uncharacterized protein
MLSSLIISIVDNSRRFALVVVLLALALTLGLGWYAGSHFKINTDINQLLSDDLPWRQKETAMAKEFPQKVDNLVIVIDGKTPDETENAAAGLAAGLKAMPELFTLVERPDALPFFRKNGLLFFSKDELSAILDQLVQSQPLLGMLTSDPSLRGLAGVLFLMSQGYEVGQLDYSRIDRPFTRMSEAIEAVLAGKDKPLELQSLMGDGNASPRDLRKFIITRPVLDYHELESGKAARDAVRKLAADLFSTNTQRHSRESGNPSPRVCAAQESGSQNNSVVHRLLCSLSLALDSGFRRNDDSIYGGISVRMTGSVALNDEEFASVAHGTGFATLLSGFLVLTLLLAALRSLRIVLPILLVLVAGLVATLAFALAAIGSLNMISVAFAVMFIGIAVDFSIQFGVRYRDQHHLVPDHAAAMTRTAALIAMPLTMAAASTALGFLAFIPTAYKGVSELGMIAGAGMAIAFILNVTLLPALLALTKPPAEREAIGYAWAAPVDSFILAHRRKILAAACILAVIGLVVANRLQFDFDPLNLKDPKTESVATMFDVMQDPDSDAYAVEALRPSLSDAEALAEEARKLPEVDHVLTLASFVPDDQKTKLAMIADARALLEPTVNLSAAPPPTADENYVALQTLAGILHSISKDHASADRLATALDETVARHDEKLMERLSKNLIGVMQGHLSFVKDLLAAEPVAADTITDDLRRDWVSAAGRYRVQIQPKGDARDHATLIAFTEAVRGIAPDATGTPISIQESGKTVTSAFIKAGLYALAAIGFLSLIILRSARDVLILLAPLILAGILTLATIVAIGLPLNFANIIALPLLLSLGVSYAIYFVSYARMGYKFPLQSSMARAVLFSAATVLVAFGSLSLSSHPGTAGMGKLLTVALVYSLLSSFLILPALLASRKRDKS